MKLLGHDSDCETSNDYAEAKLNEIDKLKDAQMEMKECKKAWLDVQRGRDEQEEVEHHDKERRCHDGDQKQRQRQEQLDMDEIHTYGTRPRVYSQYK